tara:strand:+ start:8946 stop:9920 length:975 start_codon:yes stop_codon:yes gene_type:complete
MVDRPAPVPGHDQVLVAIDAVALNYRDLAIISGSYAPDPVLPIILASDAVGRIVAVGDGVRGWQVGDRVIGCYMEDWQRGPSRASDTAFTLGSPLDGVLCEQRVFPQSAIVLVPSCLSDNECASLPIAAVTAWCALFEHSVAQPGETVLVQGSGGVATFAIQLAAAAGLRVIALSRSAKKLERSSALGAAQTLNRTLEPDWGRQVLALTEGKGADVILDIGGQGTLAQSVIAAAQNGRIAAIGILGGAEVQMALGPLIVKNLTLRGITVGSKQSFEAMLRFVARTGIRPVIDSVFAFDEVPGAFARLSSGKHQGKICINIGHSS